MKASTGVEGRGRCPLPKAAFFDDLWRSTALELELRHVDRQAGGAEGQGVAGLLESLGLDPVEASAFAADIALLFGGGEQGEELIVELAAGYDEVAEDSKQHGLDDAHLLVQRLLEPLYGHRLSTLTVGVAVASETALLARFGIVMSEAEASSKALCLITAVGLPNERGIAGKALADRADQQVALGGVLAADPTRAGAEVTG